VAEYKVVLHREAERELGELYDYIADQAGAAIAWNFSPASATSASS